MAAHLLRPLDLYTLPLTGVQLVEASAGTGKTWTIAGLYVRLLLETPETVDRILVVTFTKAATAELRDRLRTRLVDVQAALQSGTGDDPFCQWALQRFEGAARALALAKLTQSLRRFDEAAIHTIHGFCQRVLGEAQLPQLLGEPDIVPDEREWLPGLVQEGWIRLCDSPLLADLLHTSRLTPDTVQRDVELLLLKPYLQVSAGGAGIDAVQLSARQLALRSLWQREREHIVRDVTEADALSRARDQYKALDEMLAQLDAWLRGDGGLVADLRKLTPAGFEEKRKQKGRLPEHDFWRQLGDWFAQADTLVLGFRQRLLGDVHAALAAHKKALGLVSYQDLLALLADAVADERLAADIRSRYGAALIDEFQDTDPLQFRIFDRLYAHKGPDAAPLYLVGDPKQAIYSFRGADIFTYLRARQSAEGRYTLDTNRRSLPPLVDAVNGIFTRHANPFLLSDLPFPVVGAVAHEEVAALAGTPFQCWLLPATGDKPLDKKTAITLSVDATVAEILRLLADTDAGIDGQRLRPGDIAVLVPRHRDGRAVTDALAVAGVPAVIRSQDSVFASTEAREMLSVLEAVAEPGREGRVKAAFLTTLMGGTVDALFAAQENDVAWSALVERLLEAREHWHGQGFMAMWENWLAAFGVNERVLGAASGERRLTNLRHLATLAQQQADTDPVPKRQLDWLREQVREAESNEETQLRLESDAERVQVLTIHVSKGLEYPVVFCPFLWDGALYRRTDEERAEYRAGADSLLDIGSAKFAHARTRMATERLAERLRVLYVALTRAKYRCYGIWGRVKDSETSPFSWLLLGGNTEGEPDAAVLEHELEGCTQEAHADALRGLAAAVPQGFSWCMLPAEIAVPVVRRSESQGVAAVLPDFTRQLVRRWRVSSFTGLSEGAHGQGGFSESPDHDTDIVSGAGAPVEVEPCGLHAFPRGARAGVFWHAVLEDCVGGDAGVSGDALQQLVADRLQEHALPPEWLPLVAQTVPRLLAMPLDVEGARLGRLEAARAEMEFLYPVQQLSPARFLTLPDVPAPYREALRALDFPVLQGYLKGFIDLIYRHDGRYYVLDYKTNWLGPDDNAYTEAAMEAAIAGAHYYLQYWLYVLALHRHLRVSKKDYDYDRDIGGVRYLFLRGIDAPTRGVYARKPSRTLIESLDALMRGPETAEQRA